MARDDSLQSAGRSVAVVGVLLFVAIVLLARCQPSVSLRIAPPKPLIVLAPPRTTDRTTATFRYKDSAPGVTYRCALDHIHLRHCALDGATYRRLRVGRHVFKIAAKRGRLLSDPARWHWKIVRGRADTGGGGGGHSTSVPVSVPTTTAPTGAPSNTQPGTVDRFTISGHVDGTLAPGLTAPVNLTFSNPFPFAITVTAVTITVQDATMRGGRSNPSCVGTDNFLVTRGLSAAPVVPADATRSLGQLGIPRPKWPQVSMPNLAVNQDACKLTTFTLAYHGTATAR